MHNFNLRMHSAERSLARIHNTHTHMYTPQENCETQSTCGVITFHPILSNSPTTLQLLSYGHFGYMGLCLSFYLISPSSPSSACFYSSSLLNILFFPLMLSLEVLLSW